jgi:hypothetical protein
VIVLALFGCTPPSPVSAADGDGCDPRALAPGEVRARQIPCGDELISGGEGRVGDWLLENAHARYVIRGTYAALTLLGQEGGTLIDAARPDRKFCFNVRVTAGDVYEVDGVEPPVAGVADLVADLNTGNNFSFFAQRMRRAFAAHVAAEAGGGWMLVPSYRIPILWEAVQARLAHTLEKYRNKE